MQPPIGRFDATGGAADAMLNNATPTISRKRQAGSVNALSYIYLYIYTYMAVSDFCFNVPGRPQFDAQDSAFRHFEGRGMGGGREIGLGFFSSLCGVQ